MRAWCIWGLLLVVSLSWAQGLDAERDPRLRQSVSLRVPATPLRLLLRQLEKQTGVELRVESRLREYRACARVQNRPLYETLSLLAEAFGYAWRAEPTSNANNAPLRYVLYQPDAERKREEAYRRLLTTDILQLAREALRLIPAELLEAELYGYDAWRSVLEMIGLWERTYHALRWYAALNATQRAALQRGATLPYAAMTPPQRTLFAEALWRSEFTCFEASPALLENAYAKLVVEEDQAEVHLPLENRAIQLPERSYEFRFYLADKNWQAARIWHYAPQGFK